MAPVSQGWGERLQSHKFLQELTLYSHVNTSSHICDIGIVVIIG